MLHAMTPSRAEAVARSTETGFHGALRAVSDWNCRVDEQVGTPANNPIISLHAFV